MTDRWLSTRWGFEARHCLAALLPWLALVGARGDGGISQEGSFTVFHTGTNGPLVTLSLPLELPSSNAAPLVQFDFGFATDEPSALETFFDAFSVTLADGNPSDTALLLTADRSGVQWAPPNAGGMTVQREDLTRAAVPFPGLGPALDFKVAYLVSYLLPSAFLGHAVTLFFDLFDNGNASASLAFVADVHVATSRSTNQPPPVLLESSAAAAGPFAGEMGAVVEGTNRQIVLPQFSPARFFRVASDLSTVIRQIRVEGNDLVISYAGQAPAPVLQSASQIKGAFGDQTNAVVDPVTQTISVPVVGPQAYFRLRSGAAARLFGAEVSGSRLILHYEWLARLALQSSASPGGPFAEESGVRVDTTQHAFRLPRVGAARFYRLRSATPARITGFRIDAGQLVFRYE